MIRPASNRPSAPDRHGFVAAAMFFVVAMLIRFHHLDGQSLWNDEMFSIDLARSSFPALLQKLTTSYHHPPLFFSILHVIFRFFDDSVQALRFVPALAGSVTVSVVYLLGRRICNNPAGISAATLCLVSPFHLAYSQEGRPYSLAALLTLVAFFLIAEYIDSQKRRRLILYMLTAIALLYTHYWGLFVVGGHVLFVLCYPLAASIKKSFFLVFLFVALAFVPVLPALLVQSSAEHAGGWWWVETPSFQEAADVVGAYAGSSFNMASSVFQQDPWIQLIGLISCCAL
ncbi:MAG TPA: glycosyltransferase family 39 protein, partial [Bacteroidota bacterium]|nr:glycosyltransferase family 39 protein [Bacteroidota bacterium]